MTKDKRIVFLNAPPLTKGKQWNIPINEMTFKDIETIKFQTRQKVFLELGELNQLDLKGQIYLNLTFDEKDAVERLLTEINQGPHRNKTIITSSVCSSLLKIVDFHPDQKIAYFARKNKLYPIWFQSTLVSMNKTGATIILPEAKVVTKNFMDQAKARNWKVFPWISEEDETQNREYIWTYLKTIGVNGICTNFPRQLYLWHEETKEDDRRHTQAKSELEARISSLNIR